MSDQMNHHVIQLMVNRVDDILFTSSIPLSHKRRINRDAEEYIIEEAEYFHRKEFLISIQSKEKSHMDQRMIEQMVHTHFLNCKKKSEAKFRSYLRSGRKSLLVGMAFLVGIYLLTKFLDLMLPEGGLFITLRELFIILGWVAMWRPADMLLYEWRPFKREVKLFEKLASAEVRLILE